MKQLKYCKDCKYSLLSKDPYDRLKCLNLKVNAKDYWVLASTKVTDGKVCSDERGDDRWFGVVCGLKGKLFEPKLQQPTYTEHIVDL